MPTYTPNHGLTRPIPFDAQDVDEWGIRLNETVDIIDKRMARSGTLANRPAAGLVGRKYIATDQTPPKLYVDDGTNWVTVGASDELNAHINNTTNPHAVTAAQVDAPTNATFTGHTGNASAHHARPTAGTHLSEDVNGAFNVASVPTHGDTQHDATVAGQADLDAHTANTTNPHSVTAAQAGAPTTAEFNSHLGDTANPHSVTAAQASAVALANFDPAEVRTGTLATRPAAGTAGRWYHATDGGIYYDSGTAWVTVADVGGGGTGSGLTAIRDASTFAGANGGAKIQAAINDLPAEGGSVYVPPTGPDLNGRWDLTAAITMKSNVHLWGIPGATRLFLANGANDDMIRLGPQDSALGETAAVVEEVTIEGFVMDGNRANNTKVPDLNGRNGACIYSMRSDGLTVRNVDGANMTGYVVQAKGATNVLVENCRAENCSDDGFSATDIGYTTQLTRNVTFKSCVAVNNVDSGFECDDGPQHVQFIDCFASGNVDGFTMHNHDPAVRTNPGPPIHVHHVRCTANDNSEHGFVLGANHGASPTMRDYTYHNIVAKRNGVAAFNLDNANGSNVPIHDVLVDGFFFLHSVTTNASAVDFQHGDTVTNATLRNGKVLSGTGGGGNGIRCVNGAFDRLVIQNVDVEDTGGTIYGINVSAGVGNDKQGVIVRDCRVTNFERSGIIAWHGDGMFSEGQFVGNEVANNGQDTTQDAIRRSGFVFNNTGTGVTTRDTIVKGNIVYGHAGHAIYRINADYMLYSNNILRNNPGTTFGGTAGANSLTTDNIV